MSSPRPKKSSFRRRSDRQLSIRSVLREEPDVEEIAGAVFAMALSRAQAEMETVFAKKLPDPFVCDCMCNCCQLRRFHDGLCPQPSDQELERVSEKK